MEEVSKMHNEKETMKDDYSLVKVPPEGRTLGWLSITNVTFGIATAVFYIQMGSTLALQFGAMNALLSSIYAAILSGVGATLISYLSAKSGMNVNLLSRGGGFGFKGASLTSLIYASNFIMYCAFEGILMVYAVNEFFPQVPKWALIVFFGAVVIPLNWYGIKQLDKLQKWTLPIWVLALVSSLFISFQREPVYEGSVWTYLPEGAQVGGMDLLMCIGVQNGITGLMLMLISDYARFLKKEETKKGALAIGFIPQMWCFIGMGVIGIWFGVRMGEANPGVYLVQLLSFGGVLFTILTQIRINITNIYSSSLSLANFSENIFNFKPGRNFWVVFTGIASIILMLGDILSYLGPALTIQGVFLFAWAAILMTDAIVVKKILKIGPKYYEHRQSLLYAWNPVGVVALMISSVLGSIAAFGHMGVILQNASAFFAMILASVLTVIMAIATKGKYYIKNEANDIPSEEYIA